MLIYLCDLVYSLVLVCYILHILLCCIFTKNYLEQCYES